MSGALALAIVVTSTAVVFADPVTITVDRRSVVAIAPDERVAAEDNDTLVATAGETNLAVVSATLASSFANPLHWFGAGAVNLSTTAAGNYAASTRFEVDFTVTSPVTYTFEGSFAAASVFPDGCRLESQCAIRSFAVLWPDTGRDEDGEISGPSVFGFSSGRAETGSNAASRSFTGLLMPGPYVFHVATSAFDREGGTATSTLRFTFDLAPADTAPVPEPASLLLLSTGLAGLFRYRGRPGNRQ